MPSRTMNAAALAAVLGLALPSVTSAQSGPAPISSTAPSTNITPTDPTNTDISTLNRLWAMRASQTRALLNLKAVGSNDIGLANIPPALSGRARALTTSRRAAAGNAALLRAMQTVQVNEAGGSPGQTRTLADHLRTLGINLANVVAVRVNPSNNLITVYSWGNTQLQGAQGPGGH